MLRTTRIFLADDHVLVRQGLRSLLEMEEDIVIVGEASNGADAVEKVQNGALVIVLAKRVNTRLNETRNLGRRRSFLGGSAG
jgi:DNA-binding NarL/FixJ family response regulator